MLTCFSNECISPSFHPQSLPHLSHYQNFNNKLCGKNVPLQIFVFSNQNYRCIFPNCLKDTSTKMIHGYLSLSINRTHYLSSLQFLGTSSGFPGSVNVPVFSSGKPNISDDVTLPFLSVLTSGHCLLLMILDSISLCLRCSSFRILSLTGLIQQSPKMSPCFVVLLAQIHPAHRSQSQREVFRNQSQFGMAGLCHSAFFFSRSCPYPGVYFRTSSFFLAQKKLQTLHLNAQFSMVLLCNEIR